MMDLRNLSSTPPQLDSIIQRRPSLSSLSSASGYESSNFNASMGQMPGGTATTPRMIHTRTSAGQGRMYPALSDGHGRTSSIHDTASPLSTDVGPWVEQQKQQQSFNVASMDSGHKYDSEKLGDILVPTIASSTADESASNSGDHNDTSIDDDDLEVDPNEDLIPTAIVMKNIPFAIKKEQLLDVMTKLSLPLPYAFNYHFDNGVFRGLAFANFASTDETSMVVNQLNGHEIGGRKLRVEYKKMLPLQQREKIEREKREKRGQLEEQHRAGSTVSLNSLVSAASTTAATKNLSVNGQACSSQTERHYAQFPMAGHNIAYPPTELNLADPEVLELYSQLLTYRDDTSKLFFELAFPSTLNMAQRKVLSLVCSFLNLLELFDNGLIIIRRKPGQQTTQQRLYQSTAYNTHLQTQHSSSAGESGAQRQNFCTPPLQIAPVQIHGSVPNGISSHSSSMINLSQMPAIFYPGSLNVNQPDLSKSQSQSALPQARSKPQSSKSVQQHQGHYVQFCHTGSQSKVASQNKYHNYGTYGGTCAAASSNHSVQIGTPTSSSAAALLRTSNNRSFVDVRSSQAMGQSFHGKSATGSPTPSQNSSLHQQPAQYFGGPQTIQSCQSGTPRSTGDMARFMPFGQHPSLHNSMTSLQGSVVAGDEYGVSEPLNSNFNALNLNGGYDPQKGSGIWGPRK